MAVTFLTNEDKTIIDGQINQLSEEIDDVSHYVTPQMFGAVADGVADDTVAINAALSTGHNVYFPEGVYKTTSQISALVPCKISMAMPYPISGSENYPKTNDDVVYGARIDCYDNNSIGVLIGDSIQIDGMYIRAMSNFSGTLLKYDGSQGVRSYPSSAYFRDIRLDSGSNANKLVSFFDFCPDRNYGISVERVTIGNKYMYQFSDYGFRASFNTWANSIKLVDFVIDCRSSYPMYIKNNTGDSGSAKNWIFQNIAIQACSFTDDMLVAGHNNCFYCDYIHETLFLGCKVWDAGAAAINGDVVKAVACYNTSSFGCDPYFDSLDTVLSGKLKTAADSLNISGLTMTVTEYDSKSTLTLSDGTYHQTADIEKVRLSDEQIKGSVGAWMDYNMIPREVPNKNIFNPNDTDVGMGFIYGGGSIVNHDAYWITGYMPAVYGDTIRVSYDGRFVDLSAVASYNADKVFIAREGYGDVKEYTLISENVAYVRLCIKIGQVPFDNVDAAMITLNNISLEFEKYGTHIEGGLNQYMILMSPNGNKYTVSISDDGVLSTTLIGQAN